MAQLQVLKRAVRILEDLECKYCLIGGHAASLYRLQERLTKDVDFALAAEPISNSRKVAEKAIENLGLKPIIGFIPQGAKENKRKVVCMVTSVPGPNEAKGVIDILLPELPWIPEAIERAQHNRLDLGFAKVPVITPEDLILAKCYAVKNSPDRFQDLDDLKEIFQNKSDLDLEYLRERLIKLELTIPEAVRKFVSAKLVDQ